uniref:Uncharacterized protein n=1 Tax=Trichogramma kaykai TaxID=54128 RepID=A0ABD2WEN2_9HYME
MPVERVHIVTENKKMWPIEALPVRLRIADDSFVRSQPCDESGENEGRRDVKPVRLRWSHEAVEFTVELRNLETLERLKSLRENIDWTNEKERKKFFQLFYSFITSHWWGEFPDTKDFKSFRQRIGVRYFGHDLIHFLQKEVID